MLLSEDEGGGAGDAAEEEEEGEEDEKEVEQDDNDGDKVSAASLASLESDMLSDVSTAVVDVVTSASLRSRLILVALPASRGLRASKTRRSTGNCLRALRRMCSSVREGIFGKATACAPSSVDGGTMFFSKPSTELSAADAEATLSASSPSAAPPCRSACFVASTASSSS